MPIATANLAPEEKKDLKTCPGGWVVLRRMTYGQKLDRMKHVGKLSVDMRGKGKGTKGEMEMLQKGSTIYDFQACIVEHNLEKNIGTDENPNIVPMNLKTMVDIDALDPRIGEEISSLIDELNNFEIEEGDGQGNSSTASVPQ
jgi:hypothetical protein